MRTKRIINCVTVLLCAMTGCVMAGTRKPNILFCISDDQSYAHTGANGDPVIQTPAFDRIARDGLRFTNAFCDAPTCGPSRSAILTNPLSPLSDPSNGTPKRPTPKANS
jgi:N-sulfoglucosamine sulfohydrolase